MDIVFCINENYLMPCGVLMTSILYTNSKTKITFHVISEKLSIKAKEKLQSVVAGHSAATIQFYYFEGNLLEKLPKCDYPGIATYIRIFIPHILPKSIQKVLYLDCDMIVIDTLEPLWNTNIEQYSAAAAMDFAYNDIRQFNRLGYTPNDGYYNAGMLLINLDYWRNNTISEKLLEFARTNPEKCLYADQDMLNKVLAGTWKKIPSQYNCMTPHFYIAVDKWFIQTKYWDEVFYARENPVIIHFSALLKPWHIEYDIPLKKTWLFFKRLTLWKNDKDYHVYYGVTLLKFKLKNFLINTNCIKDTNYLSVDINFDLKIMIDTIITKLRTNFI
ncbi:LPS 1,2-glucosyltransferase [Spirochaetia bacterium]|nr:LPS 1,2-glucosyltransferase [Spirochaetia bacterium]